MGDIKPIETLYKGYRFRSRLEARWAVFFDALGIPWEYEKEGYQLSDGSLYLPDFWLPNQKIWVEIKGEKPEFNYYDMLERFCDDIGQALLLAIGLPSDYYTQLFCWDIGNSSAGGPNAWDVTISALHDGQIHFGIVNIHPDRTLYADSEFEKEIQLIRFNDTVKILPSIWEAAEKAKAARFEHGENGVR